MYVCILFSLLPMRKSLLICTLVLLTLGACTHYERLLNGGDYALKYSTALDLYKKQSYNKASKLFDQVSGVYRGTSKGDSAAYLLAMSHFQMKDYQLGGYNFEQFYQNFPYSSFSEEAQYMAAYCTYLQSPREELDQDMTAKAIESLKAFVSRYPGSDRSLKCIDMVEDLQDRLVQKSYLSAKLYFDMGEYKAAIVALTNSLAEYPETKHRQEVMFMILEAKYNLAYYSVPEKQMERYQDTVDEYFSFTSEFPQGSQRKEADKMYEAARVIVKE